MDVAAVAADPDLVTDAGEDLRVLNVLEQGEIALLVELLNGGDALKLLSRSPAKPSSWAVLAKPAYMSVHS